MMLGLMLILVALAVAAYLAFSRRLARSESWTAMVTPLASIMGSGFLVSAPLLAHEVGNLAVLCMAVLLALAYALGGALRFNIRHFEPIEHTEKGAAQSLAHISRLVLAAAYFISITYYLELLAAFGLNLAGVEDEQAARWITTALLLTIGGIGASRGLVMLERVERYAISLNLGVIAALLVALVVHNVSALSGGAWALPDLASTVDLRGARVLLGLLIVVQGFETSRYLGSAHSAEVRIRTMRLAQLTATGIYLVFLGAVTILFQDGLGADVTAIITMVAPVSAVLVGMLSIAAIGSQFSAAVADTSGAGGLLEDLSGGRLSHRSVYLVILAVCVALTWETDVNQIIAYASRAFALYYALQCLVAFAVAHQLEGPGRGRRLACFGALTLLCVAVFLFGLPAE